MNRHQPPRDLTLTVQEAFNRARHHHQNGRLAEAEQLYRQILDVAPNHADTIHLLGVMAHQVGRNDMAIELIGKAIANTKPAPAFYYNNLGEAFRALGRIDDAIASYTEALRLKPDYPEALSNLGTALQASGKVDEAIACYARALRLKPDYTEAHNNLGNVLKNLGRLDEAIASFAQALRLKPDYAEAHNNLGNVLMDLGRLDEAEASYRRTIGTKPNLTEAHNNLGNALMGLGRLDEAEASYRRAIAVKPDYAEAHSNLGSVLTDLGRLDEAEASYRQATTIRPDLAIAHSNLFYFTNYFGRSPPEAVLDEARRWGASILSHEDRRIAASRRFPHLPSAGRRLRIGYVSGDYRSHAISFFVERLFALHDRQRVEVFVYSTGRRSDEVTTRLQALADGWVSLVGLSDEAAADRVRADGVAVLIDLSGHTNDNRLGVFARRAAPAQVHYLGFFGSTGLSGMDYWIGDGVITPPETDGHFSETVWRLPRTWVSYHGRADAPETGWRPAADGTVWLGSFNALAKLTPASIALWARILRALPEAKLRLKTKELAAASNRERILEAFARRGVAPERIALQDRGATEDWSAHMACYDGLDIALDPVGAVGGGTTTCDALWMGAPVIALLGDRMASRMTASMLEAIGRPEWIARDEDEYVQRVVDLARDVEGRSAMRAEQRARMAASPLCDTRGLARALEDAYEAMVERRSADNVAPRSSSETAAPCAPSDPVAPPISFELTSNRYQPPRGSTLSTQDAFNRALHHHQNGRLAEAERLYRQILEVAPNHADSIHLLGVIALQIGASDKAVELIGKAIANTDPVPAFYHNNLGEAFRASDRIDEAIASFTRALHLKPDYVEAHNNLGNILKDLGRLDEAIACFTQALRLKPDFAEAHGNLIYLMNYLGHPPPEAILDQARRWEDSILSHEEKRIAANRSFPRLPSAGRRLRIGYVSGDYCRHAASFFIERLFALHDRQRVEVFAYSTNHRSDEVTARLRALADGWVSLVGLSDDAAADRVRADGIAVLIDLSGHTSDHRLGVFARRAAPTQAHYIGFFGSTGLSEMDYWIGDGVITPPETDGHFSETVWRLPRTWVSYHDREDAPESGWRPAADGTVWLGSFNNLAKLTPASIALWARALRALPEAKLRLKTKELAAASNRERVLEDFARWGVGPERIALQDRGATEDWSAHMACYDGLDIALDPVGAVGGGTTTCDALWMGVPVIALLGDRMASRMTASMLEAIGRPEWIARDEDEYLRLVVDLARDVEGRSAMRAGQRARMAASPLCDTRGLAHALEDAYQAMVERRSAEATTGATTVPATAGEGAAPSPSREIPERKTPFHPVVPPISLELTNRCNLKCRYCGNGGLTRPRGVIDWTLLEKLVDDCADGRHNLAWLHGTGEPLLYPRLEDAIRLIKSRNAGDATFGTNGTLLNKERVKSLLEAGLTSIYVSIDTLDPDLYRRTRGGDLRKVIENVMSLIGIAPNDFRITIALMNHKHQVLTPAILAQFSELFGAYPNVLLNRVDNTLFPAAPDDYRVRPGKLRSCHMPRNHMTIACDGRVSLCCVDQDVANELGDINKNSVAEIWFNPIVQDTFRRIATGAPGCPKVCVTACNLA